MNLKNKIKKCVIQIYQVSVLQGIVSWIETIRSSGLSVKFYTTKYKAV